MQSALREEGYLDLTCSLPCWVKLKLKLEKSKGRQEEKDELLRCNNNNNSQVGKGRVNHAPLRGPASDSPRSDTAAFPRDFLRFLSFSPRASRRRAAWSASSWAFESASPSGGTRAPSKQLPPEHSQIGGSADHQAHTSLQ
mmetsp:Transcript_47794/g.102430  ORF Transcript_47794/g.102430 Transcript_47794/m.102430 type:complete len:141 (+) Transcript_47794:330-752(+)